MLLARAYRLGLRLAAALPARAAVRAARVFGFVRFALRSRELGLHPRLVSQLGARPGELGRLKRRAFELWAVEDLEFHLLSGLQAEELPSFVDVRGIENLDAALEAKRGAVLYSGHIRSHHTVFAALSLLGYRVNVVGYPPVFGPNAVEIDFQQRRNRLLEHEFDCRFLHMPHFAVAARAATALRRNEVVVLLIDVTISRHTADVPFLGGPASFPRGPALIAESTGAAMIDFYARRDERWLPLVVELGSPHLVVHGDLDATIAECAARLEAHVRRSPAEWYMFLASPL